MADDPRLLEAASAVADGSNVDWDALAESGGNDPSVIRELRVLADVVRAMRRQSPDDPSSKRSTNPGAAGEPANPPDWGHLRILDKLGGGSYGVVYRAWDTRLHCDVALKLARPSRELPSFDESRALNEARMLARVRHRNVVKVFGADSHDGRFGLWMESIAGRTLAQGVAAQGPMGAQEAAHVGVEICHALAAVHAAGLLHRDVKATNVMRENGGRIVLMDFGAGRPLALPEASRVDVFGTPHYLAPELFEGANPTRSSDIYSLGVLLYFLVTGQYPVDATTVAAIETAHRRNERRALRDARPDLPAAFVNVIERALSPVVGDRYQTAGAFGDALSASVGAAYEPSHRQIPVRKLPRIKTAIPVAVAVAAIAVAVVIATRTMTRPQPAAVIPETGGPIRAADVTLSASNDYQVEAAFYALRDNRRVRLNNGSAVAPGDRLFLDLKVSRPAYVYLVNQDDKGSPFALFPLEGQELTNPVPTGQSELPGSRSGVEQFWQVSSAGGREHFLVYVSPTRLTELESLLEALPHATPGRPVQLSDAAIGVLRSVGGLTAAPSSPSPITQSLTELPVMPDGSQAASGVWARKITFANPEK